jgi:O-antigen/teichoic acid export membrane protein
VRGSRVRIWRPTLSSDVRRSFVRLLTGAALGQGAIIAVSPIITRLYSPEAFSALAVFVAITSILGAAGALRYEAAVPLPKTERDGLALVAAALVSIIVFSGVVAFGVAATSGHVRRVLGLDLLGQLAWLIPLGTLALSLHHLAISWGVRSSLYTVISRAQITKGVSEAGSQVLLGFLLPGPPAGLLVGNVLGRASGSLWLMSDWFRETVRFRPRIGLRDLGRVAWRYRRFPLVGVWSAALNAAAVAIVPLMLAYIFGPRVTGHYALAHRVLIAPSSLVGGAAAHLFVGHAANHVRCGSPHIARLVRHVALSMVAIGIVPFSVVFALGPDIFTVVFGPEWTEAGSYARWLSILALTQLITSPVSQTLYLMERQGLQLVWDIGRTVVTVAPLLWAMWFDIPPLETIRIYSLLASGLYLTLLISIGLVARTFDQARRREAEE